MSHNDNELTKTTSSEENTLTTTKILHSQAYILYLVYYSTRLLALKKVIFSQKDSIKSLNDNTTKVIQNTCQAVKTISQTKHHIVAKAITEQYLQDIE